MHQHGVVEGRRSGSKSKSNWVISKIYLISLQNLLKEKQIEPGFSDSPGLDSVRLPKLSGPDIAKG